MRRTFTKRQVGKLEPRIRKLAGGYLDPFVGAGGFDYVADFGAKLPVTVISSLLGAPEEDQEQLRMWSDLALHREPGETGPSKEALAASSEMHAYWHGHIRDRRKNPRDDVMSELAHAKLEMSDGTVRPLTDGELYAFYLLISSAGNETVARFLGWAATLLAANPGERRKLARNRALIPGGVEEILRIESPSPIQAVGVHATSKRMGA